MGKKTLKTVKAYRKWKWGSRALRAGTFICPLTPATVLTAVKWEEWFGKSGLSLPFGFACLIVAVVSAIVGIMNSDTVFKKADIALLCVAGWFMVVGCTCLFLATLLTQMGMMFIYVGCGLVGSGVTVLVDKKVFKPNIDFYAGLISENKLDRKSKRRAQREEQARKDAEEDAKRQATE